MSDKPDGQGLTVDLMLRPEWSAVEGIDKDMNASDATLAFGETAGITYVVPVGKRLYITDLSGALYAAAAANADLNQICAVWLSVGLTLKGVNGGNGGASLSPKKPWVATAGQTVTAFLYSFANHSCSGTITLSGYEVSV